MPTDKKREILIRKFYLLAWFFGLLSIFCIWRHWHLAAGILFMFFIAYSRADYIHPNGSNDNGNDDAGGLAA